ncbi:hypothetical protein GCM10011348_07550 [Marinobacterium nitratireducens]|uniref:Uncharacterized protein n=1 Tax=Marinobacterium nitratireducens TaxID=518897 RepID=A0A917Z7X6_9GAMM|nr:hypothetical protein [Marinobacterium nitratireducens]GGO77608.1 hypothetical protein GCM10011348_07550 [Marinobacterium nitratireducens]
MDFSDSRIGINDAARLLNVRTSELKAAIHERKPLRGVEPPEPMYRTGSGGLVFRAGDVMAVASLLRASLQKRDAGFLRDQIKVPDDFDRMCEDEIAELFNGK